MAEDVGYIAMRSALVPRAEAYADKSLGIQEPSDRDHRWDRLFMSTMDLMTKREIVERKISECHEILADLFQKRKRIQEVLGEE